MSRPQFTEQAWNEYLDWHAQDKKTLKKINRLISDIMRSGALCGEGEPELLKGPLSGYYTQRINEKDNIIENF